MRLELQIEDEQIIDSRFQVYGCPASIAAAAWAADWAVDKSLDQARNLSVAQLEEALQLPPVKRHCALLAQDALSLALDQAS